MRSHAVPTLASLPDARTGTAPLYLSYLEVYGGAYFVNDVACDGTIYGTHAGDGSQLGNLNAAALTSGTLPAARLPAGVPGGWTIGGALTLPNGSQLISISAAGVHLKPGGGYGLEISNGSGGYVDINPTDYSKGLRFYGSPNIEGALAFRTSAVFGGEHNASLCPSVVRGASGQTAPLQQWRSSAGVALASVGPGGELTAPKLLGAPIAPRGITVDGGGSVVATGLKGPVAIEADCKLTGWYVDADAATSCSVGVYRNGTLISGASPITLTAAASGGATTLTGWTVNLSAGDRLTFSVDNNTAAKRLAITLRREAR